MVTPVDVRVVRKRDLSIMAPGPWDDPDGISTLTPEKRRALLHNPLSTRDDDPVRLIGVQGETVIGKLDLLMGAIRVGGDEVKTIWTSDLFVPPRARNTLVAIKLLLQMQRLNPVVSACNVSQLALPLYQKLKWADFLLPRHFTIRRSRSLVQYYLGNARPAALASRAADAAFVAHAAMIRTLGRSRLSKFRCVEVDEMPSTLDAHLPTCNAGLIGPHRSSVWINWLLRHSFRSDPRDRKGLFLIYGPDDQSVGYVLLKLRFYESASHRNLKDVRIGSLQDWGVFSDLNDGQVDSRHVMHFALRILVDWNADLIELCTDDPMASAYLRRLGMPRFGGVHILIRSEIGTSLSTPAAHKQKHWRLEPAEGDNFFS